MKWLIAAAAVLVAVSATSVHAQTATATGTGTGIGVANSKSQSQATAIGGGNATGGQASSAVTINSAAQPAVTTAVTSQTVSGTQTLRNVPTVFAPGLSSAGLETCLGSFSVGAGWIGAGLTGGSTVTEEGCAARLDARTLWSFGLKKAAIARLCLRPAIYESMPEVCVQYLPRQAAVVGPGPIVGPAPIIGVQPTVVPYNPAGPPPVVLQASSKEQEEIDKLYVPKTPIELIDGKTGKQRVCNDYNVTEHLCRRWAKH